MLKHFYFDPLTRCYHVFLIGGGTLFFKIILIVLQVVEGSGVGLGSGARGGARGWGE